MRNKHYIITLSIAVAFALIVVIWTCNCVNISEDRRWVDLAQTFLYPLSCTVIGSAILTYAGLEISDKVLENYMDSTITAYDADIAILCIEGEPTKKSEEEPTKKSEQNSNSPNKTSDSKEMSKWEKEAHDQVTALKATLTPQQALIVYTDGWLHDDTKAEINNRPFSVLVNFRGRIVTDIHSLLTTLPPRNGD